MPRPIIYMVIMQINMTNMWIYMTLYANLYENHYIVECARYNPFIVHILPSILETQAHSTKITQIPYWRHQQGTNGLVPNTLHNKIEVFHSIVKMQVFTNIMLSKNLVCEILQKKFKNQKIWKWKSFEGFQ
jgi:hypothetical protein